MTQRIGLPHLPRRAKQNVKDRFGIDVTAPNYRQFYDAAVEARIPAEFVNGRWSVAEADLDQIVDVMGMAPARTAAKPVRKAAQISAAA